ncbi:MAG: MerR family transcriptional regulator [Nostoc sp.]
MVHGILKHVCLIKIFLSYKQPCVKLFHAGHIFYSKQAAEITGCTPRQLQYWREKRVIVPVISETGTGRSIYYSKANFVELAVMVYLLSAGLSFDLGGETLKTLKDKEPELFKSVRASVLCCWEQ